MWRHKDKNNNYIARLNPLEKSFRVYYEEIGNRRQTKIIRSDMLNHKKLIDVKINTFKTVGGIGLWQKSGDFLLFDGLKVCG